MMTIARRTPAPALRALLPLVLAAFASCDLPTAPPRFQPSFVLEASPIAVPVTSAPASSFVSRDLTDLDPEIADRARGGALLVGVENGVGATGVARVRIDGGGATVEGEVALDGSGEGRIPIDEAAMRALLADAVLIRVSGTLCPASGCGVRPPPFPQVTFQPRLEITFEIGGEG